MYGKHHVALRISLWEKGFRQGHGVEEHGLSAKSVEWLDKVITAYYTHRIKHVLAQIGVKSDMSVQKEWDALCAEMCGDSVELKDQLIKNILNNEKISKSAKDWVKQQ